MLRSQAKHGLFIRAVLLGHEINFEFYHYSFEVIFVLENVTVFRIFSVSLLNIFGDLFELAQKQFEIFRIFDVWSPT